MRTVVFLLVSLFCSDTFAQDFIFGDGFENGAPPPSCTQDVCFQTPSTSSANPAVVQLGSTNQSRSWDLIVRISTQVNFHDVSLQITSVSGAAIPFQNFSMHETLSGIAAVTSTCGTNCYTFTYAGSSAAAANTTTSYTLFFDVAANGTSGSQYTFQVSQVHATNGTTGQPVVVTLVPSSPDYIQTN